MRIRRTLLLCGGLLAGIGLGAGCGDEPAPDVQAPSVMLAAVEAVDLVDRIEATGELEAPADAEIAAEISGRVTGILVDEGEAVEAGTVVIEIDPERRELDRDAARAGLGEALAALKEAERDHERIRKLHERSAASASRLDAAEAVLLQARSRHAAARAQLGVAQHALDDAQVAAPFAGSVAARHVTDGEFVDVGRPLFRLVALDPVDVRFRVAERDSARVSLGDAVQVQVAPFPDERFEAQVTMVSPTIDPTTRTLLVKAELPNPDGRLRPGLFARVDLGVDVRRGVLMVPEEAVLQRADGAVLFRRVEGNRVERRTVELGVFQKGKVEVRRGLEPGDVVVARGHARLVDGAVVTPRDADGNLLADGVPAVAERGP